MTTDDTSDAGGAGQEQTAPPEHPHVQGLPLPDATSKEGMAWRAMELAVAFVNLGNLANAVQWFNNAARMDYPGAAKLRDACQRLHDARIDAELASMTTGEPDNAVSTRMHEAQRELDKAHFEVATETARRLIAAAEQHAGQIVADAHMLAALDPDRDDTPPTTTTEGS